MVLLRALMRVLIRGLLMVLLRALMRVLIRGLLMVLLRVLMRVLIRGLLMVLLRALMRVLIRGLLKGTAGGLTEGSAEEYVAILTLVPNFRNIQLTISANTSF